MLNFLVQKRKKKGPNLISDLPLKLDILFFRIAFELLHGGLCKYLHLISLGYLGTEFL